MKYKLKLVPYNKFHNKYKITVGTKFFKNKDFIGFIDMDRNLVLNKEKLNYWLSKNISISNSLLKILYCSKIKYGKNK